MGSGKTTLGKRLAQALNRPFLDSDKAIEQLAEMSISEIFETHGEAHFRTLEHQWLSQLEATSPAVIATGGGLPCHNNNMELFRKSGLVLYLQRPAKELFQRLKNAKTARPLLANRNDEQLLEFIEQTLKEREVFYQEADVVLSREEQGAQPILDIIKWNI